jgi:putative ABC transport system ATP-binding protein
MITLKNITKTYDMGTQQVHALRGVDLSIREGEFVAIMGTSGSGKSTLMHIIGSLDTPTTGQYMLNGKDASQLTGDDQARLRNRQIGFIFQQFNLLARTPALKQVEMPLMYGGIKRAEREQRAREALQRVGLAERLHHRPDELSGGQQQRVAIARALVTNPALILADEPTGALDSESGEDILRLFTDMHAEKRTIVLITHDADVAHRAQRVITLRDGRLQSDTRSLN